MPNVIRLGDPTSHGGKVISAAASDYLVDGIAVVRVGDLCSCPVSGHGVTNVVEGRMVKFSNRSTVAFAHSVQDGPGDGTVPQQSCVGPGQGVKQLFRTRGYDHQGSYMNESMLALTMQLIARITLEAK